MLLRDHRWDVLLGWSMIKWMLLHISEIRLPCVNLPWVKVSLIPLIPCRFCTLTQILLSIIIILLFSSSAIDNQSTLRRWLLLLFLFTCRFIIVSPIDWDAFSLFRAFSFSGWGLASGKWLVNNNLWRFLFYVLLFGWLVFESCRAAEAVFAVFRMWLFTLYYFIVHFSLFFYILFSVYSPFSTLDHFNCISLSILITLLFT